MTVPLKLSFFHKFEHACLPAKMTEQCRPMSTQVIMTLLLFPAISIYPTT